MNARHLPNDSNGIDCPATIERTINGATHTFVPAMSMTPELLRVEGALGEAEVLLNASQAREAEAKNLFFDTLHKAHASKRRTTKNEDGHTQHWRLRNGEFEKMTSDEFQYELDILGTQLSNAMKAPYVESGKALLRAFRFLMLATPKYVERFAGFRIRNRLTSLDESQRLSMFEAYRKSLEATVQKGGFRPEYKAIFERFIAMWLKASLQAQAGFIQYMSFRNQCRDNAKKYSYAVIMSELGGMTHSFLPAVHITPKFFRFEKSLGKVFALLNKASKQAAALRQRGSRDAENELQRTTRVIIAYDGSCQYWVRGPVDDATSSAEQMTFNGKTFVKCSGNFAEYFRIFAEGMNYREAKLYVAVGQCMADTFRLFENAARPTLVALHSYVYEDGVPFESEYERQAMFSDYIDVCRQALETYQHINVGSDELTPSFERLVAAWLLLPAPAKSAFLLDL